ncbi:MAG: hypothetical protein IJW21_05505 [Clostridia bacterium]|nr:hypothetical protein [Clostridia bacterium]
MAEKAKRTGRNVVLEPMNAYERRIIHSEVQGIEGASTNSVGVEGNRRVIIFPEGGEKAGAKSERKGGRGSKGRKNDRKRSGKAPKQENAAAAESVTEAAAPAEKAPEKREKSEYTPRPRRTSDTPRPAPRKIEKAKDLDSYFARLKEFGSTINSQADDKK